MALASVGEEESGADCPRGTRELEKLLSPIPPPISSMSKEGKDAGAGAADVPIDKTDQSVHAKKPSSTPSLIQAAILKIRRYTSCRKPGFDAGPNSPIVQDDDGGGASSVLKSFVDGMRPLHLQPDRSSPLQPPPLPAGFESFHDVSTPPPSPHDAESRYASAEDLRALDADAADQDGGAADGSKNSVDVMADEFIARFYEQMRLQRLESMGDDRKSAVVV